MYLKRIVMTAKHMYIQKNDKYINNRIIAIKEDIPEISILDDVIEKCQGEVMSAMEFEKVLSDPKLYNIVKALSLQEKKVLFYLYKEQKTINEIVKIMKISRMTVYRLKNKAQEKIAKNLIKGDC